MARVNLNVPFAEKDAAKELGAEWDRENKIWYVPNGLDLEAFSKWLPAEEPATDDDESYLITDERVDLQVPFKEKDEARKIGAKWDPDNKTWYVPRGLNLKPFSKWIPLKTNNIHPTQNDYFYFVIGEGECSKCKKRTSLVAFGIPYRLHIDALTVLRNIKYLESYEVGDQSPSDSDPSEYDSLTLIPEVKGLPKELQQYLRTKYNYHKRKWGSTYNNFCDYCGWEQSIYFTFDDAPGPFCILSPDNLKSLEFYRVELSGRINGFILGNYYDYISFEYALEHHIDYPIFIEGSINIPS